MNLRIVRPPPRVTPLPNQNVMGMPVDYIADQPKGLNNYNYENTDFAADVREQMRLLEDELKEQLFIPRNDIKNPIIKHDDYIPSVRPLDRNPDVNVTDMTSKHQQRPVYDSYNSNQSHPEKTSVNSHVVQLSDGDRKRRQQEEYRRALATQMQDAEKLKKDEKDRDNRMYGNSAADSHRQAGHNAGGGQVVSEYNRPSPQDQQRPVQQQLLQQQQTEQYPNPQQQWHQYGSPSPNRVGNNPVLGSPNDKRRQQEEYRRALAAQVEAAELRKKLEKERDAAEDVALTTGTGVTADKRRPKGEVAMVQEPSQNQQQCRPQQQPVYQSGHNDNDNNHDYCDPNQLRLRAHVGDESYNNGNQQYPPQQQHQQQQQQRQSTDHSGYDDGYQQQYQQQYQQHQQQVGYSSPGRPDNSHRGGVDSSRNSSYPDHDRRKQQQQSAYRQALEIQIEETENRKSSEKARLRAEDVAMYGSSVLSPTLASAIGKDNNLSPNGNNYGKDGQGGGPPSLGGRNGRVTAARQRMIEDVYGGRSTTTTGLGTGSAAAADSNVIRDGGKITKPMDVNAERKRMNELDQRAALQAQVEDDKRRREEEREKDRLEDLKIEERIQKQSKALDDDKNKEQERKQRDVALAQADMVAIEANKEDKMFKKRNGKGPRDATSSEIWEKEDYGVNNNNDGRNRGKQSNGDGERDGGANKNNKESNGRRQQPPAPVSTYDETSEHDQNERARSRGGGVNKQRTKYNTKYNTNYNSNDRDSSSAMLEGEDDDDHDRNRDMNRHVYDGDGNTDTTGPYEEQSLAQRRNAGHGTDMAMKQPPRQQQQQYPHPPGYYWTPYGYQGPPMVPPGQYPPGPSPGQYVFMPPPHGYYGTASHAGASMDIDGSIAAENYSAYSTMDHHSMGYINDHDSYISDWQYRRGFAPKHNPPKYYDNQSSSTYNNNSNNNIGGVGRDNALQARLGPVLAGLSHEVSVSDPASILTSDRITSLSRLHPSPSPSSKGYEGYGKPNIPNKASAPNSKSKYNHHVEYDDDNEMSFMESESKFVVDNPFAVHGLEDSLGTLMVANKDTYADTDNDTGISSFGHRNGSKSKPKPNQELFERSLAADSLLMFLEPRANSSSGYRGDTTGHGLDSRLAMTKIGSHRPDEWNTTTNTNTNTSNRNKISMARPDSLQTLMASGRAGSAGDVPYYSSAYGGRGSASGSRPGSGPGPSGQGGEGRLKTASKRMVPVEKGDEDNGYYDDSLQSVLMKKPQQQSQPQLQKYTNINTDVAMADAALHKPVQRDYLPSPTISLLDEQERPITSSGSIGLDTILSPRGGDNDNNYDYDDDFEKFNEESNDEVIVASLNTDNSSSSYSNDNGVSRGDVPFKVHKISEMDRLAYTTTNTTTARATTISDDEEDSRMYGDIQGDGGDAPSPDSSSMDSIRRRKRAAQGNKKYKENSEILIGMK
eukprot:gene391-708_t